MKKNLLLVCIFLVVITFIAGCYSPSTTKTFSVHYEFTDTGIFSASDSGVNGEKYNMNFTVPDDATGVRFNLSWYSNDDHWGHGRPHRNFTYGLKILSNATINDCKPSNSQYNSTNRTTGYGRILAYCPLNPRPANMTVDGKNKDDARDQLLGIYPGGIGNGTWDLIINVSEIWTRGSPAWTNWTLSVVATEYSYRLK